MKTFNELYNMLMESFVTEKRNPKHDYSEYTLRDLAKKFGSDDYIFRFSNSDERASFNPKAYYNTTPIGTYGYPAKYFLNKMMKKNKPYFKYSESTRSLEYGNDMKYLYILKKKDGCKTFDTSKQVNNSDIEKLKKIYNINEKEFKTNKDLYKYVKSGFVGNIPTKLTNIFFKVLGYDSIKDNYGIIHPSEPHQEVILNPVCFTVVEKIDNFKKDKEKEINTINVNLLFKDKQYRDKIGERLIYNIGFIRNRISYNKILEVVKLLKKYFNKGFSLQPLDIFYIPNSIRFEIVKTCVDGFNTGFSKIPTTISFIPEDKRFEVVSMCKQGFNNAILNCKDPYDIYIFVSEIPEDKRFDVVKILRDAFNVYFSHYPDYLLDKFNNDEVLEIFQLCKNGFEIAFKNEKYCKKYIQNKYKYELKELFPDINFPE